MKKPFSSLAIAIVFLASTIVPGHMIYADDAPGAPAGGGPIESASAPAPAPDPVPAQSQAPEVSSAPGTSPAASSAGSSSGSATSPAPDTSVPAASSEGSSVASIPPATSDAGSSAGSAVASTSPVTAPATGGSTGNASTSTMPVTSATSTSALASTTPSAGSIDEVNATSTQAATTTSISAASASTGNNTASSSTDTAIQTGDAVAAANIVNVVNVNLFNSDALIAFLDNLSGGVGNINLDSSAFDHDGFLGCQGCSTSVTHATSTPSSLSASTTDTATISNATVVRATTGGNDASGGNASVQTGNAYAAGNVATLANSTLVDSRYIMLVLNNFGSWGGDLVLPNSSFWDSFLNPTSQAGSAGSASSDLSVSNAADVSTVASTSADTGSNTASSTDGSSIQTGSAQSAVNTVNDINHAHVGGGTIDIIFHIFGNWSGQTFNLPPGFTATPVPGGIEITASNAGVSGGQNPLSLSSSNTATIQNALDVSASTGGNTASGSTTGISTGNAYAAANTLTSANVTSISHNWLAAIVNIFGDWNGNVSFGQPNLWVGITADLPDNSGGPGGHIIYRYTIKNRGNAAAHDVRLTRNIGSELIVTDPSVTGSWDIGTLEPGETREVTETARVAWSLPDGAHSVSDTATVSETETDGFIDDNTDVISVVVGSLHSGPTVGGSGPGSSLPHFIITKTADATSTLSASTTVGYAIHLVNDGGRATHAIVADEITDANGAIIHEENWDLGPVQPGEDITLTYSAFFSASTTPGRYMNSAKVFSGDGQFATSTVATTSVDIGGYVSPVALVSNLLSSYGYSSGRIQLSTTTPPLVTVHPPLMLGFLDRKAPLPPEAGGGASNRLVASVGAAASGPYAWPLYLLVISAGAWYLVSKRKSFGWGEQRVRH